MSAKLVLGDKDVELSDNFLKYLRALLNRNVLGAVHELRDRDTEIAGQFGRAFRDVIFEFGGIDEKSLNREYSPYGPITDYLEKHAKNYAPSTINNHPVKYSKSGIKVGCQEYSLEQLKAIVKKCEEQ